MTLVASLLLRSHCWHGHKTCWPAPALPAQHCIWWAAENPVGQSFQWDWKQVLQECADIKGRWPSKSGRGWQPLERVVDFRLFLMLVLLHLLVACPVCRTAPWCTWHCRKAEVNNGSFPKDWQCQKGVSGWCWLFRKFETTRLHCLAALRHRG